MSIDLRVATEADQALLGRALYAAWQWRHPWDESSFTAHIGPGSPDSYVDDYGRRPGDTGVIAEERSPSGSQFVGAAWYRFFTSTEHRSGFVAEDVPELVVAVEASARGRGVGRRLMLDLIRLATTRGVRAVALHVSADNVVAAGLYRSLGFEFVREDEGRGLVMSKPLHT